MNSQHITTTTIHPPHPLYPHQQCLDALGVQHGPSHAEVMWLEEEDQPCLVEVGARPHGGEGTFAELSTPGIGYNQLEATIWALVAPEKHRALPPRPGRLKVRLAWVCGWAGWVGALTALAVCVLGSVLGVGVGGGERRTDLSLSHTQQ